MATLREIRKRITSVTKISKVTDAMRMVATAKLRRAQSAIEANRPYADKFNEILGHLLSQSENLNHPLIDRREIKSVCIVSVSGDRGLCGSFNSNVIRETNDRIAKYREENIEVELICVGRRTADFFRRRYDKIVSEHINIFQRLKFESATDLAGKLEEMYTDQKIDKVEVIYNDFRSAIMQVVLVDRLLPLEPNLPTGDSQFLDYLYEPSQEKVLENMLSKNLYTQIWKILLDSNAAENAARMTAMENATKNAKEIIDQLVLQRNRARQTNITKEISEIVGGAEALN